MRKREIYLVAILIVIGVIFSLSQTILYFLKTPPDTYYPFVHNYIEDYYYYLHVMRQGWEGKWLATSWLTPEVYPAQFVNPFFLFLGHIARWLHLSLSIVYTLARAIGAIVLYFLSYQLITLIYPKSVSKRIVALGIVIFGTYWWGWNNGPTIAPLVHDWTALDPLFRASYIPHHLWSKIFMIGAFLSMIKVAKYQLRVLPRAFPRPTSSVTLGSVKSGRSTGVPLPASPTIIMILVLVFLMGFSSPVTLITFLPVIVLWFMFEIIAKQKINFGPWLVALGVGLAIAYYHQMVEHGVFPWNSYIGWEHPMRYLIGAKEYVQTLGPQFLFFLVALPWLWEKREGRLLIAWVGTSWVLLFFIGQFLPLSMTRFLDGYQFIPIGIGAAQGVWIVSEKIAQKKKKIFQFVLLSLLIGLFSYFTIGIKVSWNQQIAYIKQNKNNPQVYLPNDYLLAFQFLDTHTPRQSVVLAPYTVGTMIPAFTGNRVVAGHQLMTRESAKKRKEIDEFYSLKNIADSKKLLDHYRVAYVWIENASSQYEKIYAIKEVYRNSSVTIYARQQ